MSLSLRENPPLEAHLVKHRTVLLVALMWIIVGVVHGLSRYSDIVRYSLDVPFSIRDIGYFVLSYASWVVVTLALLRVLRDRGRAQSLPRVATLFVVGLVVWLPCYFAFDYGVSTVVAGGGWGDWLAKFATTSGSVIFFYAVVYALTFAVCVGMTQAERARDTQLRNLQLEQQRAQAALELAEQQMQVMQSQLSPHFLFNSLGALSYLARSSSREALTDAIARLGNLLRFTIENASRTRISVHDEIEFAQNYVALQALRFGDRFVCHFDCDISRGITCLPFTLQPIVENVFRHVVEQLEEDAGEGVATAVRIGISIGMPAERVQLRVCNSRPDLAATGSQSPGFGTGMKNLEARLAHRYGSDFSLTSALSDEQFCVELEFPADRGGYEL